jgi:hypothetical protein
MPARHLICLPPAMALALFHHGPDPAIWLDWAVPEFISHSNQWSQGETINENQASHTSVLPRFYRRRNPTVWSPKTQKLSWDFESIVHDHPFKCAPHIGISVAFAKMRHMPRRTPFEKSWKPEIQEMWLEFKIIWESIAEMTVMIVVDQPKWYWLFQSLKTCVQWYYKMHG